MKSLLLKDFFIIKGQLSIYGILLLFYLFIAGENIAMRFGMSSILVVMLVINSMAYDERAKWDKYGLSMPLNRTVIVLEKYVLALLLMSLFSVGILGYSLVLKKGQAVLEIVLTLLGVSGVMCVFIAILLPLFFRFGVEKARLLMMLVLLLPTASVLLLGKMGIPAPKEEVFATLLQWSPLLVILLMVSSLFLSLHFYKRREF